MKISKLKKIIFAAFFITIFFIACEKEEDSGDNSYAIVSVSADKEVPTRKLIITVSDNRFVLTVEDIKINAKDFSVIKGEIKQKGMIYELTITPGGTGTIRVGLDPYRGFTGWNAKPAYVNADWYFKGTEELTITGYSMSSLPSDKISLVIAGKPVTAIGNNAFFMKRLTDVDMCRDEDDIDENIIGIKVIGDGAFAYNQLTEIVIPESVVSIGSTAFAHNQLSKVTIIGDNVTFIGYDAFSYNELTEISIPKEITDIKSSTFAFNRLTKVNIPDGVKTIGTDAFTNNNLIEVTIPSSVTSIGNSAFANNRLTNINIPNGVKTIGSNAFAHNELNSVSISNTVTDIDYRAFANNKISKITIPAGVKNIDTQSFIDNPLTEITIGADVTLGSSAFGNNFEYFYYKNKREKGTYTFAGSTWSYTPIS